MTYPLSLDESLALLPNTPGVYIMFNELSEVLYVGKAKSLKKRVKSYFSKTPDSPKLGVMVPQIKKFEFIITDSEVEALILESQLIKKYQPKYNILLKDDKRFPWFLITEETYPRIVITRKADKKIQKGRYFGPYTDSRAMYSTLEMIKKIFPLKQCKNPRFKNRPCMYYQIGKCLGPCQNLVTSEEYINVVKQVELFLSGKQNKLLEELKSRMEELSEKQEYEKAARYRDSYFDVMKAVTRQKVISENTDINLDVIGYQNNDSLMAVVLLKIRDGRLIAKEDFDIRLDKLHSSYEALIAFIQEYYQMIEISEIPKELLVSDNIEQDDENIINDWLSHRKGAKVSLLTPKMQKKYELVEMAKKNAESALEELKAREINMLQDEWNDIGREIQNILNMPHFPNRIECFDISHIQGTNTVGSMVVFVNGKPFKSEYRKYKIKSLIEGQTDDYACIKEVVKRRYKMLIKNIDNPIEKKGDFPDIIIIDGGKGQLSAAVEVFDELGLNNLFVISIAKKFEEIFIPKKLSPIILPKNSKILFLFQQIRDEAHRFAISYHRKLRESGAIKSILDEVTGMEVSHKKLLMEHFGDIDGIQSATKSELTRILGKPLGYRLYKKLHP
jgi:excinuclease ABC subunit C